MDVLDEKRKIKRECFRFFNSLSPSIHTKMSNVCGKTGQYNVPDELFQKRTSRKNRVLISWRDVKNNNFSIEQLKTFYGGVVVEFLNYDYLNPDNQDNETFIELRGKLGSDEVISSIISFRNEDGSSSSAISRDAFDRFLNHTIVTYKGEELVITKENYKEYALRQICSGGKGNEKWKGFLFVSIRGGQQDTRETHHGQTLTLFNPACEYANEEVSLDIDLTLSYFAMKSISYDLLSNQDKKGYDQIIEQMETVMSTTYYSFHEEVISLLDYCNRHPSLSIHPGKLTDPIQLRKIDIEKFKIKDNSSDSIDFTHNEAVNKGKYYWDEQRECILTPARPTNIFWSYHLSNMMQQDFDLSGYLKYEKDIYNKRQQFKDFFDFISND